MSDSDGRDSSGTERAAGGLESVVSALRVAQRELGARRSLRVLGQLNQAGGFDCPGCAWPEPERRAPIEFCENGAKAVAHEATRRRFEPGFFRDWPIRALSRQSDHWLEQNLEPRNTDYIYEARALLSG